MTPSAPVFNIQRFSVHDGPGIRTTVFFKGCNLRCRWCHNPESFSAAPQIQYFSENCSGCGACSAKCPAGVRVAEGRRLGAESCVQCGLCAEICTHDALKLTGKAMTAAGVMEIVLKDKAYYDNSGGGLTLSGGEPLLNPEFCAELLRLARAQGIHTALDTAANVPYEAFSGVLPHTGAVLLDLKMMDSDLHKTYTGSPNGLILENARRLFREPVDLYVRIPLIAGINDTEKNIARTEIFLRDAVNLKEVKFTPYHALGINKAQSLGLQQETFAPPDEGTLKRLAALFPVPVVW